MNRPSAESSVAAGATSPRRRIVAPLVGGAEAYRLLGGLGWEAIPNGGERAPLQLAGSMRRLRQGVVARVGHGELSLRATWADPHGAAMTRLIAVVSGGAEVIPGPGAPAVRLDRGKMLVLVGGGAELRVAQEFVRYEYAAPTRTILRADLRSVQQDEAFTVSRAAAQPFLALASAVLDAPADGYPLRAAEDLSAAMNHVTAVILRSSTGGRSELSAPEAGLVSAAEAAIAAHAGERGYGVQQLAEELGVSRAWLHRVFAKLGTTPSAQLREPR